MSAAVFGLIGVLLGGLITAGTQWIRDRFVRRRERVTAARLVASELGDADAAMKFAEDFGQWWPNEVGRSAWETYAPVLSAELTMKEWLVVLAARDATETGLRTREASGGALAPLPPGCAPDLKVARAKIKKGIDWLAAHSYNFPWWKIRRHFGLWVAKRELHKDGPDVPT